jgi:hypothetical protein
MTAERPSKYPTERTMLCTGLKTNEGTSAFFIVPNWHRHIASHPAIPPLLGFR